MNKFGYILIIILAATFLNQILTDFFFKEAIFSQHKDKIPAVKKYENCLKTNPKYLKAMLSLAFLYVKTEGKGGLKKGFDLLKKIENIDYYFHTLHFKKALIYCEWRQWDRAIEEFNIALEQRKADPNIYYNLGRIYYWGKKDHEKAKFYFEQAVKYGAGHKDIANYLKNIKRLK